jgi:hypothetical protein
MLVKSHIHSGGEDTYQVASLRGGRRGRRKVCVGAPDRSLTAVSGMAAISELVDRLGVIESLDAAVGLIKQRDRGFSAGELLVGLPSAQLAGEDFLTGLNRQRADVAGQEIAPVAVCDYRGRSGAQVRWSTVEGCGDRGGPGR